MEVMSKFDGFLLLAIIAAPVVLGLLVIVGIIWAVVHWWL